MLEIVKKSMRITHSQLDDVLLSDIYAGAAELERVGVSPYATKDGGYQTDDEGNRVITDNPLVRKTIEMYVKAVEDFDGKGTRYMSSFKASRDAMALSGGYRDEG